ncbi:FkbM family methyltransferase [Telmatobacter bradus]|uniref:FkbM family methyltransferase n=1 Tax=Telmatobacter bradus TaxID=474953 RepID=UPI003B4304C7
MSTMLARIVQTFSFFVKGNISRVRRIMIGRNVEAFAVNTCNGRFLIDPEDIGVGGKLIKKNSYGQGEIERICSLVGAENSVLFVGSHIGTLAIPVSKKTKIVTAIEANPRTFQLLSDNILLNKCSNINAIQIAASDREGNLSFVASKSNSGGSKRMPLIHKYMYFYDNPEVIEVHSNKLDSVISNKFDLIVMDIEGSEYFALKGMPRLLSDARHLIVEFVPHHLKNVASVSVDDFLSVINPYFDMLYLPSKKLTVKKEKFSEVLNDMYDLEESDDGVIFSKL